MVFLRRKKVKGKKYFRYAGSKTLVPSKAELLRRALRKAVKIEEHAEFIDFIPARMTLQLHSWLNPESDLKKLSDVQRVINKALRTGKDPLKEVDSHKAKCHWDLRVQKRSAPVWFGITLFRAPWTATAEKKAQGVVKGYASIVPGGRKLSNFLRKEAGKALTSEGIRERMDRLFWMKLKARWMPKGSLGNPTATEDAFMIAVEYLVPCVIHRRELDFFDWTFFGKYLKGRYYYRLVERKLSQDEMTKEQKAKAKPVYGLFFYFWRAKKQWGDKGTPYTMQQVKDVATKGKSLEPVKAPPAKK